MSHSRTYTQQVSITYLIIERLGTIDLRKEELTTNTPKMMLSTYSHNCCQHIHKTLVDISSAHPADVQCSAKT